MCKDNLQGAAFDDSQRRTSREFEKLVEQFCKFYDNPAEFFDDLYRYYNGFESFNLQLEKRGKIYDNSEDLLDGIIEYYNGFPEFYDHTWKKAVDEWLERAEERCGGSIYEDAKPDAKPAKGLADEDEKVLKFMAEEAAKRDAEVDAALAAAKAAREAERKAALEEEAAEEVLTSADAVAALADAAAEADPEKTLAKLDDYIASREKEIINSKLNNRECFEAADLDDLPPMRDYLLTFEDWKADIGSEAAKDFDDWHELGIGIDEVTEILKDTDAPLTLVDWIRLDHGLGIPNVWGKRTFADWDKRGANTDEALTLLEEQGALSCEDWERLRRALKVLVVHYKTLADKGTTTTTKEG